MKLNKLPLETIGAVLVVLSILIRWAGDGYRRLDLDVQISPYRLGENAAVFAAYSEDGTVSQYVIDYLKKLKKIAPNIVYVTDNPLQKREYEKLEPYVTELLAYKHGEYDWGSYKRGVARLVAQGNFKNLVLANDSTLPLIDDFDVFLEDMVQKKADVYGITANIEVEYHLQSYFLILAPDAWQNEKFYAYLNAVEPEIDGLYVAYRYEVPFTKYMEELGYKSASYLLYEDLSELPLNDKNCYPLTMISKFGAPFLKMRTFTDRLDVKESRRLVFAWLKKNKPLAYDLLIKHLTKIKSPYLKDNRS